MNKTIIIIFSLLTGILVFVYLWHDPVFTCRTKAFNLEKIHDFFEAFGALATAAALFFIVQQTSIARKELTSKNDAIVSLSIPSVKVEVESLDAPEGKVRYVFGDGSKKDQLAFMVENHGPAIAKSVRLTIGNYYDFDLSSMKVNEKKDRYFPASFSEKVKLLIIGVPIGGKMLMGHFYIDFRIRKKTVDNRDYEESLKYICSFERFNPSSGMINFEKIV